MPLIYHQQHSRLVSKLSSRSERIPSPCNHMYRSEPLPSSCNHTYGREISSCLNENVDLEIIAVPVEECKKYPCWTSTNDSYHDCCPENYTKLNSYRSCLPHKTKSCSMELTPQALHISDTATLERKRHKRSKAGGVNKGLMSWFSAWQHRRAARKATK